MLAVVAVVLHRGCVLAGRRRDGIPPWTLPGGKVQADESLEEAVEREVLEECGLVVRPGAELGRRIHPRTGRHMVYVACEPVGEAVARAAAPHELTEVCWLCPEEVRRRMPDLFPPIAAYLAERL